MRILIAPDSYKDALRASAAARHIAEGVRRVRPEASCDLCPVSDGGEGFVDAMAVGLRGAARVVVETTDPLGRPIEAAYAFAQASGESPATSVIELAAASGLELLTCDERDPTKTTTWGTGVLIREALERGVERVLLGIGGSATTDAGCGLAQAVGVVLTGRAGDPIATPVTGADLSRIRHIDVSSIRTAFDGRSIRVACDVTNPLFGPNGAAHIYGPQKGATPEQVQMLDAGLRSVAEVWREAGLPDVAGLPGSGAAGGVGGGLVAMLGAELCPGAALVLDAVGFDERLAQADLVLTGEGRLDGQSLQGKAAMAVAARASRAGVPCIALVGCVGEGADRAMDHGLTGYRVIGEGLAPQESIARTAELMEAAAAAVIETL